MKKGLTPKICTLCTVMLSKHSFELFMCLDIIRTVPKSEKAMLTSTDSSQNTPQHWMVFHCLPHMKVSETQTRDGSVPDNSPIVLQTSRSLNTNQVLSSVWTWEGRTNNLSVGPDESSNYKQGTVFLKHKHDMVSPKYKTLIRYSVSEVHTQKGMVSLNTNTVQCLWTQTQNSVSEHKHSTVSLNTNTVQCLWTQTQHSVSEHKHYTVFPCLWNTNTVQSL